MPELARFYGISIRMYFGDHLPPHFHARYGEAEALVDLRTGEVVEGALPRRALDFVREWSGLHSTELVAAWEEAVAGRTPGKIDPLP